MADTADTVRVGIVQMCSGPEPEANLAAIAEAVEAAASGGARYVLTPEMSVAFAENRERLEAVTEPFEGNGAVRRLAAIARDADVHLHLGSMAVKLADGHFANRSLLFDPTGGLVARYDKIHLFDADLPGERSYRESATYRAGERAVTAALGPFTLGFSICYDLRFPALYRALAEAGAEVLAVPAAFTVPTGEAHWETLLRARAIETGCYVLAAAQGGLHPNGRATYGRSMAIDPWGTVVARADADAPGIVYAEIDREAVAAARRRVPALANARPFVVDGAGAAAGRVGVPSHG